jgi:hypothetical protein
LAVVEVLVGDKKRAIPRLQRLLEIPYSNCLTPALLRLHPQWDPLRADPAFQKLCDKKKPVNPVRFRSAVGSYGRTIFIADAHRGDGKRFVVRADEKLTAFVEFESAIQSRVCSRTHE